jgi:hypothetical protein
MARYSTIRVGRLTLREDRITSESSSTEGRMLSLTGEEAMPGKTLLQVNQRRDDILSLRSEFVEIAFTEKTNLNGFYEIQDCTASIENWDSVLGVVVWSFSARRVGTENEIDVESRLSGAITRANDHSAVGKRFHAPAIGHRGYWSGSTIPIYIDRASSDGTVRCYQNLAQGINPRWGIAPVDHPKGRVRFLDSNGLERVGTSFEVSGASWELSNGLLRITPGSAGNTLDASPWAAGAWQVRTWDVTYNTGPAVSFGTADYVSVLDNNYHSCTIRLTKSLAPGRIYMDITLRRGSTFAEIYIQHQFSSTLVVKRATVVAGTSSTGYITQTAADGNGMKTIVGSARTFTADAPNHAISKAATATLDAFIGVSMSGTAGDLPLDIFQQYIGSPSEMVRGVKR